MKGVGRVGSAVGWERELKPEDEDSAEMMNSKDKVRSEVVDSSSLSRDRLDG